MEECIIKYKDSFYLKTEAGYKKIVLTTDQDLIKDGIQAIDDEFLEWFVKNPSCESVEVENQWEGNGTMFGFKMGNASSDGEFVYKIIIPKEEPNQEFLKQKRMSGAKTISKILEESKQETLEEAALKHCDMLDKFPALVNSLFSFKQGAKWQQERMYSEEDIKQFGLYLGDNLKKLKLKPIMKILDETTDNWQQLETYWISQFKAWGFRLTNHTDGGEGSYGGAQWNNVPVTAFTKEGVLIKSFESQKQCAQYFNTTPGNVKAVVNGKNILLLKKYQIKLGILKENINPAPKYKSYEWINKPKNHWLSKQIKCVEDNLVFNSQTDAAKHYNISVTTINNIINGRSKKTRSGKSFCSL